METPVPPAFRETDDEFWEWFLRVDSPSSKGRTWVTQQSVLYTRKFSGTVREDGVLRIDNAAVPEFWLEVNLPDWVLCAEDILPLEVPEECCKGRLGEFSTVAFFGNAHTRMSERPRFELKFDPTGAIRIDDANCPPFWLEISGAPVTKLINCALAAYHDPDRIFAADQAEQQKANNEALHEAAREGLK